MFIYLLWIIMVNIGRIFLFFWVFLDEKSVGGILDWSLHHITRFWRRKSNNTILVFFYSFILILHVFRIQWKRKAFKEFHFFLFLCQVILTRYLLYLSWVFVNETYWICLRARYLVHLCITWFRVLKTAKRYSMPFKIRKMGRNKNKTAIEKVERKTLKKV